MIPRAVRRDNVHSCIGADDRADDRFGVAVKHIRIEESK
jgi:hypothetical protein